MGLINYNYKALWFNLAHIVLIYNTVTVGPCYNTAMSRLFFLEEVISDKIHTALQEKYN